MTKVEALNPILTYVIPIVAIVLTWVGSVYLFSIQHRKSIQNKWLDSFREQMAEFITTSNAITPKSTKEELAAFSKAFFSIQFLLDVDNPIHKNLIHKMDEFQLYAMSASNSNFDSEAYTKKCYAVVAVFRQIMKDEMDKMKKLL